MKKMIFPDIKNCLPGLVVISIFGLLFSPLWADCIQPSQLIMTILSENTLSGVAGDFVVVEAQIQNIGNEPVSGITTYLTLCDRENKLPVDLEDWSAEKGLFIGTIEPGQIFPLTWKIHFVKAGDYSLAIIAIIETESNPQVSSLTIFKVSPKINLNPGYVLPVALGMPVILVLFFLVIMYYRKQNK